MASYSSPSDQRNAGDVWLKGILTSKQADEYQLPNEDSQDGAESFLDGFANDDLDMKDELPDAMEFVSVECDMLFESDFDISSDQRFDDRSTSERKCKSKKRKAYADSLQNNAVFPLMYSLPLISELFRYRNVDVYKRTNRNDPFMKIFTSDAPGEESYEAIGNGIKNDEYDSDAFGKRLIMKDQECDICGRQFTSKDILRHLEEEHMEGQLFKCEVCQNKFKDKQDLIAHRILHVNLIGKPYPCSICKERFTNKTALKNHFRDHCTVKETQSAFCNQKVQTEHHHTSVKQQQTSEKGFPCQYCQKAFTYKIQCISHEKLHTSDGLVKCSDCNGTFPAKQLSAHQRKHTKEKFYQCDKCSAVFRARSSLRSHKKTHAGQKPRECPDCGSSFWKSSALKKHMKAHHD